MSTTNNCDWCNTSFQKKNKTHRFCSTPCRRKWHKDDKGEPLLPSFISEKQNKTRRRVSNNFIGNRAVKSLSVIKSPRIAQIQTKINWLESQKVSTGPGMGKWIGAAALFGGSRLFTDNLLVNIGVAALPFMFKKSPREIQLINANIQMQIDELETEKIRVKREEEERAKLEAPTPSPIQVHEDFKIISASDVNGLESEKYLLDKKWRYFLNYLPKSFNAIIYGLPKAGKSHLAIQFAQYLQNKFGNVMYVSGEEGVEEPFNDKLKKWGAKFNVAYDVKGSFGIMKAIERTRPKFVFIDSLNRLGLNVNDIITFKETFPNTVFMYVMQSTKEGKFKGSQSIEHEVTSTIKVDSGTAYQKGRTTPQPTEMVVFG